MADTQQSQPATPETEADPRNPSRETTVGPDGPVPHDAGPAEKPHYHCHKVVHALKIKYLRAQDGAIVMGFVEEGYAPISLPNTYVDKHAPFSGGYYVVYPDGYTSFSPAQAFEEGYTRVGGSEVEPLSEAPIG